jgi:hypothetical protein
MKFIPMLLFGAVLLPGLASAQTAEEIRSQAWCRQAVELAKQRGEDPAKHGIICEIDYTKPPEYWKCVVDTLKKEDKSIVSASDLCMKSSY